MEGQAERQPLSVNDAAAAIANLMNDDGDIAAPTEELEPEGSDESVEEPEEGESQDSDEEEAEAEPEVASFETLDDIAAEVEAALAADVTLGGKAKVLYLAGIDDPEQSDEGDVPAGLVRLKFRVQYRTLNTTPTATA